MILIMLIIIIIIIIIIITITIASKTDYDKRSIYRSSLHFIQDHCC